MISALEVWSLSGQGGAPSLFRTLEGLARRGHEIDFVGPRVGANHHHGAARLEPPAIAGVSYHLFDTPHPESQRWLPGGLPRKVAQKLAFAVLFPALASRVAGRLMKQASFDILYGYEVHGVLAGRLLRVLDIPRVSRFQGTVMHPHLGKQVSLLKRYEEVLALKTPAQLYIMTDDGTQGDVVLRDLNPGSAGKLRFWRNGLDFDAIRPPMRDERAEARRRLNLSGQELVLMTAVRLARWKRVDRAVDAVAELRRAGIEATLLVVGDGEERVRLEEQVRALELGSAVQFVGAVAQESVLGFMWASDVFLSLNELSNVGNPLLEAMRSGCCILTLDEGDTARLIQDDVNGILLDNADPKAIAAALAGLWTDSAKRERLGESARSYAEEHFWTWEERLDAEAEELEAVAKQGHSAATVSAVSDEETDGRG